MFQGFETGRLAPAGVEIAFRKGGGGPGLLLLHGYPQTHVMWRKVAPALAGRFTVVCPDLRGYGASAKPASAPDFSTYSKRTMAADMAGLMAALGFDRYAVVGHDRGARVAYRLAFDRPDAVAKLVTLDIIPTHATWSRMDHNLARAMYHWQFLAQPGGLPERMIGADPDYYLTEKLRRWSKDFSAFEPEALAAYKAAFRDPETIRATCDDYRAGATVDFEIDAADFGTRKLAMPVLALWGQGGLAKRAENPLTVWREWADDVSGHALPCGHFLPEEDPAGTLKALEAFL
jgi:haloacetate dehalogenase